MFNSALKNFQKKWEIINDYQFFLKTIYIEENPQKYTKPNLKIDVKILSFRFSLCMLNM
jgi:hypothetical protein